MEMMLDVDQAQVTRGSDGTVTIDDPGSAVVVRVRVQQVRGRPVLTDLHIRLRAPTPGGPRLTAAAVGRLPLRQVTHLAAVRAQPAVWPNEEHYRQLARPKPPGARHWPPQHWEAVAAVYAWAGQVRRPGGGTQAIADLWGVARYPTAARWIRYARRRTR